MVSIGFHKLLHIEDQASHNATPHYFSRHLLSFLTHSKAPDPLIYLRPSEKLSSLFLCTSITLLNSVIMASKLLLISHDLREIFKKYSDTEGIGKSPKHHMNITKNIINCIIDNQVSLRTEIMPDILPGLSLRTGKKLRRKCIYTLSKSQH